MASVLSILASVVVLVFVSIMARRAPTLRAGIAYGVGTGVFLSLILGAAAGFLANIFPIGQLDFWIASWFRKLGLAG
jgi:hypothetical protein